MVSKLALHTALSFESFESVSTWQSPPSKKRKAPSSDCALELKKMCDSPIDHSDQSSQDCQTNQDWASPREDVDLVAFDSLEDVELAIEDGLSKSCSSTASEPWSIPTQQWQSKARSLPDLTPTVNVEAEIGNISESPTKSGDFTPKRLPSHCLVASEATRYGFSELVISIGTTYFQRLAAADPLLKQAALGCADFAPFVVGIPYQPPSKLNKSVGAPLHKCQTTRHWLLAVHLTCIYVAAKNLEVIPYKYLLRTMLQRLHNLSVSAEQAEQLEMEVLVALDWRLGPFFINRDI